MKSSLLFFVTFWGVGLIFAPGAVFAGMPDGKLARAQGDEKVFYIEGGEKRWVDSAETFHAQGFHWGDVQVVEAGLLAENPEGEAINAKTNIWLTGEEEILPDLLPLPLYDFRFAQRNGRTILKFSATYWNAGNGPLIIASNMQAPHEHMHTSEAEHEHNMRDTQEENVDHAEHFQQIVRRDGTERRKIVGGFHWHNEHSHYHYDDFAHYIFQALDTGVAIPTRLEKATRCLWDTLAVDKTLPNAPQSGVFRSCKDAIRQGVSVGWGDEYDYTLADQYLDVHDLPTGIYKVDLVVDPFEKIIELRRDNNVSTVIFEMDPASKYIKILVAAGPSPRGGKNTLPNGALIRGDGDERVYVLHNNKKRWVRSEDLFQSYGYRWGDVRVLPKTVVDSVLMNNIVRADGKLYAVNDYGYKRALQNADMLTSYGLSVNDIADINTTELALYQNAKYIRRAGDDAQYVLEGETLRPFTPDDDLQFAAHGPYALHTINGTDFARYTIVPAAQ